jgi:hypothetical protein
MESRLSGRAAAVSVAAALFFAASIAAIAEIAADPTAEAGVRTSTWTPFRGVWSLIGGTGAFGGDWDFGPIAGGLVTMLFVATALGLVGIAAIAFLLGPAPQPAAAMLVGAAWGLLVQIVVVSLLLGGLLGEMPAYDAAPAWAWWLSTGTWGIALGLLYAAPAGAHRRAGAGAA